MFDIPNQHAFNGEALGVRFYFRSGLLDLHLEKSQSSAVIEDFKQRIKEISRKEVTAPGDFIVIHRLSRMCWELASESKLTNLDRTDADLLYDVRQEESFEWVFKIMNGVRMLLRTSSCSIAVADHVAKNIEEVMTC